MSLLLSLHLLKDFKCSKDKVEMAAQYVLSKYIDQARGQAVYDKLEDGTFTGHIPPCKGVVAFGVTLRKCEDELRSSWRIGYW